MTADGGARGDPWRPDVAHRPGCLRVGTQWFDRGRRANGEAVWELWCVDCGARLILVNGVPEADPTPVELQDPPTAAASKAIAALPGHVDALRRARQRVTKSSVATKLEVDRGTLAGWIERRWIKWPPE